MKIRLNQWLHKEQCQNSKSSILSFNLISNSLWKKNMNTQGQVLVITSKILTFKNIQKGEDI